MSTRRRGWSTPAAVPTAASPVSVPPVEGAWCWCGNQVVARCVDCGRLLCERHRLQEGQPPPNLVHAWQQQDPGTPGPPWPYDVEAAWRDAIVDPGWLGPELAEQLFLGAYGERPDLALCRDCRSQAGLELIVAWRLTTPPGNGWERARWLMDQGFEPSRVTATVDVGPRRTALVHFVNVASRAAASTDVAPDRLTTLWRRDSKGRVTKQSIASGWAILGAADTTLRGEAGGQRANLFVSTDAVAYVYGRDCDPSTGRVDTAKRGRSIEHRRLSDDRWQPATLAVLAFLMDTERASTHHEPAATAATADPGLAADQNEDAPADAQTAAG